MIEGHSFNFGKGRGGNIERLKEWSAGTGTAALRLKGYRQALRRAGLPYEKVHEAAFLTSEEV